MDPDLFSKLPHGATWWQIQHPQVTQWIQQPYIKDMSGGPLASHHCVQSLTPTFDLERPARAQQTERTELRSGPSGPRPQHAPFWSTLIMYIDSDLHAFLSPDQRRAAEEILKAKLLAFTATPACKTQFGPKVTRQCSGLFSGNLRICEKSTQSLESFLSFLFDREIRVIVRGKQWYIKK